MSIYKSIVFFLLSLTANIINAQEIPPIQVYSPETYNAETQNWSITQSGNDYIYVANNRGLLEFNGAKWKLYETPNQTILRSVKAVDNIIYTGCYMEFGYWMRDDLNQLQYTSLSKELESPMIVDEQIWNIIALDEFIVFQSLDRLYSYNTNSKSFNIINSETTLTKMFEVNNTIYYQKLNQGIFKIENGKETLFSDDDFLKKNRVINIFNIDGDFIIQTNQEGFFVLENNVLSKWNIPANKVISNLTVYSSIKLKDGSFAIGTISNGIIKLNTQGQIVYDYSQRNGLSNNTVLSVFEDKNDNIWLGLDNGINCINSSSPFRVYYDEKGQLGAVHAAKVYKNKLYLGTNQGLFVKPLGSIEEFKLVEGTKGQVWCLEVYDDALFCGHDLGTFIINDDKTQQILDVDGTWGIKQIPNTDNLLLKGSYNGLSILEKVNGDWAFRNKIDGFDISSKFFEVLNHDQILVSHEYKGVYKLDVNSDYTKVLEVKKDTTVKKGLHASLIKFNSEVLYAYEDGIYGYDDDKDLFVKDTLLSKVYNPETYVSGKLVNTSGKLWSFSQRNINFISPGLLSNTPQITRIPLSSDLRESITGYENIIPIDNQKYLIGSSSGYIVIDLDKMRNQSYRITINSISNYALDAESGTIETTNNKEFHNKNNNFEFTYSIAEFDKYLESEYQYKLKGDYDKWSTWSKSSSELFKNLPFGDYTFYVRGRVGNEITENIAEYSFSVKKPWYLGNIMVLIYALSFIAVAIMTHHIYKRNYKKQKDKLIFEAERELELKELENEQQLMSLRNEQLKQDIDNKNRELAISTMSLIKKNEFLNSIKEELKSVNKTEGLNSVIKIIDKNLNNTDDWKFFEEAFNNADKDFLKKVKAKHPSLTPNDLRLCAYLRLNLSSKEIAPLLNISSRSVEVKRYRLRKKMDLPHESSLTNYILEI